MDIFELLSNVTSISCIRKRQIDDDDDDDDDDDVVDIDDD